MIRNGYHQPREVLTSAGAVEVTAPRVNDKRTDPVGFQNSASGLDLVFYAARSYSLRRPPRTARRLIGS